MLNKRILGIDAGTSSIKVAQIVSKGRSGVLTHLAVCRSIEEFGELLGQKRWWKPSDPICIGFSSEHVLTRKITLPFKTPEKIQQALSFEIEDELPFSVDDLVAGYLLQEKHPGGTDLIAFATMYEKVKPHLEAFQTLGFDPAVVEPELAALSHYLSAGKNKLSGSGLMMEIGSRKTNLLQFNEGRINGLRCIHRGLSTEQATLPLPPEIIRDIKRTLSAFRVRGDVPAPETVYLCGGAAAIPEADTWLGEQLGIPVTIFSPLDIVPHSVDSPPDIHPACFATAVGLALGYSDSKMPSCNLRSGELAYRPGLSMYRGRLIAAGVLFLLTVGIGFGDMHAHISVREKTLETLKDEGKALYRKASPGVAQVPDAELMMRRLLEDRKANQLHLLDRNPQSSAVELLREISLKVQASIPLRLTELDINKDVIRMRGEAQSYNFIEKAKDRWQSSDLLDNVEINSAKKNPKTGLWEFQCVARRNFS